MPWFRMTVCITRDPHQPNRDVWSQRVAWMARPYAVVCSIASPPIPMWANCWTMLAERIRNSSTKYLYAMQQQKCPLVCVRIPQSTSDSPADASNEENPCQCASNYCFQFSKSSFLETASVSMSRKLHWAIRRRSPAPFAVNDVRSSCVNWKYHRNTELYDCTTCIQQSMLRLHSTNSHTLYLAPWISGSMMLSHGDDHDVSMMHAQFDCRKIESNQNIRKGKLEHRLHESDPPATMIRNYVKYTANHGVCLFVLSINNLLICFQI